MKPAPTSYVRPESVTEALDLLVNLGEDARILAGGQSLIPMMNIRLARPSCLIDINGLTELDYIRSNGDGVVIGALTRHVAMERTNQLGTDWRALREAAPRVGHFPIRVRGTFGGSISHAEPTAEFPLVALTLEAAIVATSSRGARRIPADAFFKGPLTTDLAFDEMVTEVIFPAPPTGTVSTFHEFSERSGDFALASVCVALAVNGEGVCMWARVGLGAVGPTPTRCERAEEILCGSTLDDQTIDIALDAAQSDCRPPSTGRASAEFRRELVRALLGRAVRAVRPSA